MCPVLNIVKWRYSTILFSPQRGLVTQPFDLVHRNAVISAKILLRCIFDFKQFKCDEKIMEFSI